MAIDASAVARVLGIETVYKDLRAGGVLFLPQRIAVIGQGRTSATYPTTKFQASSANAVADRVGYGSPLHLVARQLFPVNGDGVGTVPVTFYPLVDDVSGAAASGSITPSGTQTKSASYRVLVNNIRSAPFVIAESATVAAICAAMTAAINAVLEMPVIATNNTTNVGVAAKWKGVSGNDILVRVVGEALGVSHAISQPTGGLVNPSVAPAIAQVGNVWESMFLNCLNIEDTDALDALQDFGEGRWGELVRKPFVAFTGNTETAVANATAVCSTRPTDRVNSQLVAPGSDDLPCVVAARQLARIARLANNNPPHDYGSQRATGLVPGADGDQWDYAQRDQAVKAGSSTIEVKDGVVSISDVVTFYRPTGEEPPPYRHVVDIVKIQQIIFNFDLEFAAQQWDGAPLIPDDQPTVNPTAKKPKMAKAAAARITDSLALHAIISDPKAAKASIAASINPMNPKRLDLHETFQVSGNTNIKGVTLFWGFFFGQPAIVG